MALYGLLLTAGVAGAAPSTSPSWIARLRGQEPPTAALDLKVDNAGNSFVLGRSGLDEFSSIEVFKYNSGGGRVWRTGVGSEGTVGSAGRIVLDANGDVIVGCSTFDKGGQSILVAKIDRTGAPVWEAFHSTPFAATDAFADLAVDADGDVYVAGTVQNDLDDSADALVLKLDSETGDEIWESLTAGEENTNQFASALTLDPAGGVYFSGHVFDDAEFTDGLTVKIDGETGAHVWSSTYDGPDGDSDFGLDVAVTGAGVIVVGNSLGLEGLDFITIRYNAADGAEVWTSSYDGPADEEDSQDEATALHVDGAGNVYVAGSSVSSGASAGDFVVIKYNGDTGAQSWLSLYDGPGAEEAFDGLVDVARDLRVDASGNVYVTGDVVVSGFRYDIGTVKINSAGQQQWFHLYNARSLDDFGVAIDLDGAGNAYVCGTAATRETKDLDVETEIALLKFLPARRGGPAPRVPRPTLTFTDSSRDRIACVREEGETFCDEATSLTFRVNSTATMEGFDITAFDEETTFALSVGGLDLEYALGEDPRYTPGRTTATFTETEFDELDREHKALTIKLSWPRGKLRVTVTSTPIYETSIMAEEFQDVESGPVSETTEASVSLGDFVQEFDVAVTGRVTTRDTRDGEFTLSTVNLKGVGTP